MGNIFSSTKAQTPGISPSSTEESNSKIQTSEPVIAAENGKKTPVSTEEKIPEEPESNDTSYGVEATAVRTLAASTGTVAILGTTAKTLATDSNESQDEAAKEEATDGQETLPTSKSPEEPSNKTEPGRTDDSIVSDIKKEVTGSSPDFIDASSTPVIPADSTIKEEETVENINKDDLIETDVKVENIGVLEEEKPITPLESDLQKIEIPEQSELPVIEIVQPSDQTINQINDAEETENIVGEASETPVDNEQDSKGTHLDNRVSVNIEPALITEADKPPQDSEQTPVKKEDEITLSDNSKSGEIEERNRFSLELNKPSEINNLIPTEPENIAVDDMEAKTPDPSNEEPSSTPSDLEVVKQVDESKDESPIDSGKLESDSMEELLIVAENVDSGNESDIKETATNTPETLVVSESTDDSRNDKEDNVSGTVETDLIPNPIKNREESIPALDEPSFGSSVEDDTNLQKEQSLNGNEDTMTEASKEAKTEEEVASTVPEVKPNLVYESNGQHIVLGVDEEDITKSISSEQLQTNSVSDVSISESYNVEMEEANGKSDLVYHRNDIGESHQNSDGNSRNITIVLTNENNDVVDRESEEIKKQMEYLQDVKNLEETMKKINDDSSSDEHEDKMPIKEESSKQEGEETTSTETLSSCKGTDEESDAKIPSPTPNDETKLTDSENVEEGATEVENETSVPEEADNGILNTAATTIQASFRGYQTRQNLQKQSLETNQDVEIRSGNATPPELSNSMIESVKEEVNEICQKAIETTESIINSPTSAPIDDILQQSEQISGDEQKETDDVMKTLDESIEGQEELLQNQSNAPDQSAVSTETIQEGPPKSSDGEQEQTHTSTEVTEDFELVPESQQGQLISAEEIKDDMESLQKQESPNSDPNDTLKDDSSNNGDLSKEFVPPDVPTGQNDEINEAMADFPPPAPEDDYIFGEQVADDELPPPDFDALESSYTDDIETEVPIASPEHKPIDEVNQDDVKDSTDGEVTIDEDSDELKLLQRPQECAELPHQQGMDELQSEALEAAAATKIQAGVRGYLTRKQVQHVKDEPINTTESNKDNKLDEPTEVDVDVDEENITNKAKEITNSSAVPEGDAAASEMVEENNKNQVEEKKSNTDVQNPDGITEAATTIQAGFRGYQVRKQLQEENAKKTPDGSENDTQGIQTDTIRSTGEFHDMIALSPLSVDVKAQALGISPSSSKGWYSKIKTRDSFTGLDNKPDSTEERLLGDSDSQDPSYTFIDTVDKANDYEEAFEDFSIFEPTSIPDTDCILSVPPQDSEQIPVKKEDEVTLKGNSKSDIAEEQNRPSLLASTPSGIKIAKLEEFPIVTKNIDSGNESDIIESATTAPEKLVVSKSTDGSQIDKENNVSSSNQIQNWEESVRSLVEIVERSLGVSVEEDANLKKEKSFNDNDNTSKEAKIEKLVTSTVSEIKPNLERKADLVCHGSDIGQTHQNSDGSNQNITTVLTNENKDSSSDEHENKIPTNDSSKQEAEETTQQASPTPNDETSLSEEAHQGILHTAATTIQASFRGYQARQHLQKQSLGTNQDVRSGNATPPELSNSMITAIKKEVMEIYQKAIETTESIFQPSEQTSPDIQKEIDDVIQTFDQLIEEQEGIIQNLPDTLAQADVSTETIQERLKSLDCEQKQTHASKETIEDSKPFLASQQVQLISDEKIHKDAKSLLKQAMAEVPPPEPEDDGICRAQVADQKLQLIYFDIETEVPITSPENKPIDEVNQDDVKDSTDCIITIEEEQKLLQRPQECAELPHQQGMDELQSEALEAAAATTIQAGVRGYLTRKKVHKNKDGLIKTSKYGNDKIVKESTEGAADVDEEKITNNAKEITNSSAVRGEDDSASEIDEKKRSNTDVQNPDGITEAATTIQAGFRGYQVRKQLQGGHAKETPDGSENGTQGIQTDTTRGTGEFHDFALPPLSVEVKEVAVEKRDLTTERDSHQGRKRGKMVKRKLTVEEDAATLIQSTFRGYKTRQDLRKINDAATTIQANFRGYKVRKTKGRKHATEKSRDDRSKQISSDMDNVQNESATKIQAGIRGFLVRKRQKTERDAAVKIQAGFRGFKVRQQIKQNQK